MKKLLLCISLVVMHAGAFAQGQPPVQDAEKMKEIRESLRFVRLAESRKRLSFSDEKLLEVNNVLDEMEGQKIELIAREHRLRRTLEAGNLSDEEAGNIFDEIIEVKKQILENETRLWTSVRDLLTPRESVDFFLFYDRFTREVQRRMRGRHNQGKGPGPGRRSRQ